MEMEIAVLRGETAQRFEREFYIAPVVIRRVAVGECLKIMTSQKCPPLFHNGGTKLFLIVSSAPIVALMHLTC